MWPESVPCFTVDDILEPPSPEYEVGDQRTFIGWIKHLFLFQQCEDNPDCIQILPEDRKDYEKVLDIARKECKIKDVEAWEDTATRKKQAACLNKIRKKLGYTEEFYIEDIQESENK